MKFGIYVESSMTGGFLQEVARKLDMAMQAEIQTADFSEVDGLYIGFLSTSGIQSGMRITKNQVRRDYVMKLLTGGKVHFKCLVEVEADLAASEVIEAGWPEKMPLYIQQVLATLAPSIFKNSPEVDAKSFAAIVDRAVLSLSAAE